MAPQAITPGLFSDDIREFLALLDRHGVRWLLVGGHAAIFHGHIRVTGDTDVFYDPEPENCARLHRVLREFWGGDIPGIAGAGDLGEPGIVVQFGRPPNRLDLVNSIDGVTFEDAFAGRQLATLAAGSATVSIPVIGREAFLRNKRAVGRPKDLDDIQGVGRTSPGRTRQRAKRTTPPRETPCARKSRRAGSPGVGNKTMRKRKGEDRK